MDEIIERQYLLTLTSYIFPLVIRHLGTIDCPEKKKKESGMKSTSAQSTENDNVPLTGANITIHI